MHKMIRCDMRKISRRYDLMLAAANIPSATAAAVLVIISQLIISNTRVPDDFYKLFSAVLYAAAAYAFAVTLVITVNANIKLRGHRKYTYMEFTGDQLIVSEFISSAVLYGQLHDYIRIYVINLADVEQVTCTRSKVIIKSAARRIEQRSDWLEYTCEEGRACFSYWWYNENGGDKVNSVEFADNYHYAERAAQRIIFCSQKLKERELRRAEFRRRMLEIAGRKRTRKKPKERVFRGYEIERKF